MEMINTIKELTRNRSNLTILEIGPGENPIIGQLDEDIRKNLDYQAIDKELQSKSLNIIKEDFLDFESEKKFDLIIDRLCWHEQSIKNRLNYLQHAQNNLKQGGYFIGEHAISHQQMNFFEDDLLYDETSYQLFKQENEIVRTVKFIPPAKYIEKELIHHQFFLKKFICSPSKKVICNRKSHQMPLKTDPDHLFFVAQKSFGQRQ